MKILFVSSEVHPFSKTGGLADVSAGLPIALTKLGHDVRIITPAYKSALEKVKALKMRLKKHEYSSYRILIGNLPKTRTPVYFLDMPELFHRNGNPYGSELGIDWPDNAMRFNTLSTVAIKMAMDTLELDWKPDVVHCNDWQTGLIPARLSQLEAPPATVFTIHNMAYIGLFSRLVFNHLQLPEKWWDWNLLEFHDQFSFLKAGILFADQITTVSPTYAEEIQSLEYGYGLEGVLGARADRLSGILNGIDFQEWNPARDKYLATNYTSQTLDLKTENKTFLQREMGLSENPNTLLIGMIGRMIEQKGYDLVANVLPNILLNDIQVVILGSGDKTLERQLLALQQEFPQKMRVIVRYDEALAHQIEAGADIFLMPSRFEPCGLNQLYSLRYGTLPVVHHTGGLADSVVDIDAQSLSQQTANGFKFYTPNGKALFDTLNRAIELYADQTTWQQIQQNGMALDSSWSNSAQKYINVYQKAIECQELKI